MIFGTKNTIIPDPTTSNRWTLLHKNVLLFENSGNSRKDIIDLIPIKKISKSLIC